jgi:hypothetical protein
LNGANGNLEWWLTIRDIQAPPLDAAISVIGGPQDLQESAAMMAGLFAAPYGDPSDEYDARATYDSRPTNAYDAIFSEATNVTSGEVWTVLFTAPLGYRFVPRKFTISYDDAGAGPDANSIVNLLLGEGSVTYNSGIIIGAGAELDAFYLVEENVAFGVTGSNSNLTGATNVNVRIYGNLIPVKLEQLPYSVVNRTH